MIEWQLFYSFIKVGLFSFGGGYASLALIHNEVVLIHKWLTESEFNHLVTLSQMTPGPIAINAATFVGIKASGLMGAWIATVGCVLPSCIIVTLLILFYTRYRSLSIMKTILATLRPAVIALIAAAGWSILQGALEVKDRTFPIDRAVIGYLCIFIGCFLLLSRYKKKLIGVMLLAGLLNVFLQIWLNLF